MPYQPLAIASRFNTPRLRFGESCDNSGERLRKIYAGRAGVPNLRICLRPSGDSLVGHYVEIAERSEADILIDEVHRSVGHGDVGATGMETAGHAGAAPRSVDRKRRG